MLLPQALRISTPPLINEFILLIKASSLVSVVGIAELTRVSMNIATQTYRPLEAYVGGGLFYLAINLCLATLGALAERQPSEGRRTMNLDLVWHYAPSLLSGFGVTILCWAAGSALGLALGFVITLLSRLQIPPLNWLIRAFIELFRGTPFLVQLFLLYAGGPSIGLRLSATAAGILGLALYSSAYFAEIFRAGFAAVPVGQVEAAVSVGMAPFDTMVRVMLPGALIAAVPSIVNMLIILSKETVVLSIITVPELMYQVQTMAAETFTAFDAIFAMAIFYWLLGRSGVAPRRPARSSGDGVSGARGASVSAPMIELAKVSKSFGAHKVLRDVDLSVERSEVVCLIGPSGSGKSTLLRCVNFLEPYDSGDLRIDGRLIGYEDANGRTPADGARAPCAKCGARSAWCSSTSIFGRT